MNYFRDVSKLHDVLAVLYRDVLSEARPATLVRFLEEWGFTPEQASLFASTVLCRDAEGSADWIRTNAFHVIGSWVRGEQQGNVGSWLSDHEGDMDVQYRPYLRAQDREVRIKYINGAVPPILVFTTDSKRPNWRLGTAGLDTRSMGFVLDVFKRFCTPDEVGMDRQ